MSQVPGEDLEAEYFDGVSARAHPVRLAVEGRELVVRGQDIERRVRLKQVHWPERVRHGERLAHLSGGGSLRALDAAAWDAWVAAAGVAEPLAVRLQQSWPWTLAAVAALVALAAASYTWGLPWAARAIVALVPAAVDARLGEAAFEQINRVALAPSKLPPQRQQRLRQAFADAVAKIEPAQRPDYTLHFRQGKFLGPNAFALPGGTIVVTDELIELLGDRDPVLVGVLAHELGHVKQRHGMLALTQFTLIGAATSVAFGDFSNLLATVPALLGQMAYSRDFERQADDAAIALLRANGMSPEVMVELFEALARQREGTRRAAAGAPESGPGIAFSSHPADAERIARFRAAAAMR